MLARASNLTLSHGLVKLPIFMPVATQASLKGLTPQQLENSGCRLCLNNTYHLALKPGQDVIDKRRASNYLADFQMVSLLKLANITEEGVRFLSPHDNSPMLLTPEHSIDLQNSIGSDIIMQLDDVLVTTSQDEARMRIAMYRSIRWLDRCIAAHKNPSTQNLFCIIQGGLNLEMRKECCRQMIKRNTPGIAIGGLSGGEAKPDFCRVVDTCTSLLPTNKPRYVMGVGYPEDLVVSVALGADMFDCVWPTRTARFGNAITRFGVLNLRHAKYELDFNPLEVGCKCICCRPKENTNHQNTQDEDVISSSGLGVTRSFIHHIVAKETVGAHLLTLHNVWYMLNLMGTIRQAIIDDCYPQFIKKFFADLYQSDQTKYPTWAIEALRGVGVDLLDSM
ncbi:Queuine tRNA-ribosyltransferase catalytic subunit [Erysiphe neolycopersici]|uniref:Queuine tRNA-ribosyltransferase catalytic subunit n=1 Tax=Erysiphe neolycopersici TaxID=212602 RepID=A0A420I498_9PEZI|nr:Queuine tRNA-ribosyltransferase catalytic subunit [Erysiphe neolycopersici]